MRPPCHCPPCSGRRQPRPVAQLPAPRCCATRAGVGDQSPGARLFAWAPAGASASTHVFRRGASPLATSSCPSLSRRAGCRVRCAARARGRGGGVKVAARCGAARLRDERAGRGTQSVRFRRRRRYGCRCRSRCRLGCRNIGRNRLTRSGGWLWQGLVRRSDARSKRECHGDGKQGTDSVRHQRMMPRSQSTCRAAARSRP